MILKLHQQTGALWLAGKKYALLADEMRVGKTLTALEAASIIGAKRILIICPAVARFNWARNVEEHLNVTPQVALRRADVPQRDVVITSYDLAGAMLADWDLVILDESHYLRRCTAGRTKTILGKSGIIHKAKSVYFLSGTPFVNHHAELWPMLYVCGVYRKSYESFVKEFCVGYCGDRGFQITGSKNHEELSELMGGFMLRRKFESIAPSLPPMELSEYTIETPRDIRGAQSPELEAALSAHDPAQALENVAPAVATIRRLIGLAKVGAVTELVKSLTEDNCEKIVLFTYHRDVLHQLLKTLEHLNPASIYGGMSAERKDAEERRFRDDVMCRLFIGQIVAAGTNIDLSAANRAFFVESSWTPGENAQAAMRLQNMQQTRRVEIQFISMADSIDQRIQRVVSRKLRDFNNLFG